MPTAPVDVPAARPTAPDTRTGHPTIGIGVGMQWLFGEAESGRSHSDITSWGITPALQLAYPFHRHAAVEAWGSWASFQAASDCRGCEGRSLTAGLGVSLHLLDGTPLDPWMFVGVGYRRTTLETPLTGALTYQGIEALRLALGFDNYLAPAFGIGPSVEMMVGRYLDRSPGSIASGTAHISFSFGLRGVFRPF